MRDVLPELMRWWRAGESVGVGTVVATFRSAPRPAGASMLVGPGGEAVGSVSGGCVEGAVYELGQEVVASGSPVLQRYGVSDDDAFAVGLTCGGILDVFVETVSRETFPELGAVVRRHRGRPPGRRRDGHRAPRPRLGGPAARRAARGRRGGSAAAPDRLARQRARRRRGHRRRPRAARARPHRDADLRPGRRAPRRGDARVRRGATPPARGCSSSGPSTSPPPSPTSASFLGYRVTVCDARPVFATASRFPAADEVVVEWPHRYLEAEAEAGRIDPRTVVCVLTHDPKFDVPLLEVALRLPEVAYVGAMGSRRTHDDRLERLREAGVTEADLARLSSPIGLDLGARTPEETAVSIAAEIVALQWGGQRPAPPGHRRADPPPPHHLRVRDGPDAGPVSSGKAAHELVATEIALPLVRCPADEDHELPPRSSAEGVNDDSGQRQGRRSAVLRRRRAPHCCSSTTCEKWSARSAPSSGATRATAARAPSTSTGAA